MLLLLYRHAYAEWGPFFGDFRVNRSWFPPLAVHTRTSVHFPKGIFFWSLPPIHRKFPSEPKPKITFSPKLQYLQNKQTNKQNLAIVVDIYSGGCSKHWQLSAHEPTYLTSLYMHTVGRIVYSLHLTVGVHNCGEDRIFTSHINLQIAKRQGSLAPSKPTKTTTCEKALGFHRCFLFITQKRDVLQCCSTKADQVYYVVPTCPLPRLMRRVVLVL